MTQALNLANFANNLNTSGQTSNAGLQNNSVTVNTTSPIAGGGAVALGSALTLTHANSGVTATSYTNANITVNAQGHITAASSGSSSPVTSVNGLTGAVVIAATGCVYNSGTYEQFIGSTPSSGFYVPPTYDVPTNYAQTGCRATYNGCCSLYNAYVRSHNFRTY